MRKPGDRATDVTPIARAEPSLFKGVCLRCPQDFRLRRGQGAPTRLEIEDPGLLPFGLTAGTAAARGRQASEPCAQAGLSHELGLVE